MVIRFLTYLISLWMLIGASSTFAVIYKIDEWVKKSTGEEQHVFCFSDMHCDYGNQTITDKQRADIVATAKKQKAFVIVEDMDVVDDGSGVLQQKHDAVNACDKACLNDFKQHIPNFIIDVSPLRGLKEVCNVRDVPCSNVEFRQYVYNQQDMEPFKLSVKRDRRYIEIQEKHKRILDQNTVKVTFADVAAGLKKIEKEIAEYMNQGLKDYYAAIENDPRAPLIKDAIQEAFSCNVICSHEDFIEVIRTSIKKAISKEEDRKTTAAGRMIDAFDIQQRVDVKIADYTELFDRWVDARIMRCVANRVHQSKAGMIFICAGGIHIEAISEGLKALGYTLQKSQGEMLKYTTEEDIQRVIDHQSIDIANYFNSAPAQPTLLLQQPRRFSYWHIICASAVAATLGYLGYWWYQWHASPK